jgi:hypothetical protein
MAALSRLASEPDNNCDSLEGRRLKAVLQTILSKALICNLTEKSGKKNEKRMKKG